MDRTSPSLGLRRRGQGDQGIALLVVIALMAIVGILLIVLTTVAIQETKASGRDRQRSSAVMTAEGQVDVAISKIQSAPVADLTALCGALTTTPVSVASDVMSITTTVNYFTATGGAVACSAVPTTEVAKATIKSTSTSNSLAGKAPAVRTVETLLNLRATYRNALSKAIFGNASISLQNHSTISGQPGRLDADVYTNGNLDCGNNQSIQGSVFAQGSVSLSNTCTISVDVQAKKGFDIVSNGPNVSVGGKVLVSNGNIDLAKSSLGQQARASGTVTGDVCATAGKCFAAQTIPPPPPPPEPFPQYYWPGPPTAPTATRAAWEALGYTVVEFGPTYPRACGMASSKVDNVGQWISDNQATMPNTVIYADCPGVPMKAEGLTLSLGANVAVFDRGGFSLSKMTIKSNTTEIRSVYFIQPYDSVTTHPCTTVGISLDNQVNTEATIADLLYSPCSIDKANNSTLFGQIYAGGTVTLGNLMDMNFRSLPVPGLVAVGEPVEYYSTDILYKRETTP